MKEREPVEKNVKNVSYTIYKRQAEHINKLIETKKFVSKSELVREALDFFFLFPYFRDIAETQIRKELEQETRQKILEKYYNEKIIKVLR